MTPQSNFMVVAPLERGHFTAMRDLLASMNSQPGIANPENKLVPFARFENLHFARLVVLDDQTTGDINRLYGLKRPEPPTYFAFLGDFDGSYDAFMDQLVQHAGAGLRNIFSLCDGFSQDTDLRAWMIAHEQRPAAAYTNWVGRTVRQIREEERLRRSLLAYLEHSAELQSQAAPAVHQALRRFVNEETAAGRLTLTPAEPTPPGWALRHIFDWIALIVLILAAVVLLVLLILSAIGIIPRLILPVIVIPVLLLLWRLRSLEKSDPEFAPRLPEWDATLAALEDHDVTNQFSVMGSLKPGPFRTALEAVALWIVGLAARTIYTKGRLARVHTIHSARWVYLDNRERLFFASNYDGSLESYMDDFINTAGFGLNVVFGCGVDYPRTKWLLLKGASNEQVFKFVLRRHQLATEVWYNAHPGLTALDLRRNSLIREGLEKSSLTETEAREWITLF